MDLGLFRRPPFVTAVLGATAVFVAVNVTFLLNTFYLRHTRGWTPLAAGAATLPMALGATLCAPGEPGPGHERVADPPRPPADRHRVRLRQRPLTNTAVSGLPPSRAGVAGAITSTARQFGAAVGIAGAGGLVAGAGPADLAAEIRPGWLLVWACGLFLLATARTAGPGPAGPLDVRKV